MAVDTEFERRLRSALHEHAGPDALPDRVLMAGLARGRSSLRSRRRRGLAGVAASLAVVSALAVAVQPDDSAPRPAEPSPSPTTAPTPAAETVAPVAWANSLPLGSSPDVPYLAGTDVVLPDGTRVETGGTDAGVIGLSVAGLVLLVETETEHPFSFTSRYVLVTNTGELRDLPVSTLTADGAQEAVVSPDGELFASGGDILDLRDLSAVGQVPENADIMLAWMSSGILYGVGRRSYLWPVGGEPREVPANPGAFPNGTDVGTSGCRVIELKASGTTEPLSGCIDGLRSVSPSGRWALTDDLGLVDVATGDTRYLAGNPVHPIPYAFDKVWWDGDSSLLFPVGALLVRCDTDTATCERATDGHELRDGVLALP